jgi:multidrug efflux pump subunit AcrA (membrane-fusion protein)
VETVAAHAAGDRVTGGEHLLSIYSDELLLAHQELLDALKTEDAAKAAGVSAADSAGDALAAAQRKLLLLGILPEQLQELEQSPKATGLLLVRTRAGGILLDASVPAGSLVQRGERLCRVADPDPIWLSLDIPAEDLAWVSPGRRAEVIVQGILPKKFPAVVTVIGPVVDPATQTANIGIPLKNPQQDLEPSMLANAVLRVPMRSDGAPESTGLEGKFLCLRHPEFVQDVPGQCPKSGMLLSHVPLRRRARDGAAGKKVLAIPATAVLNLGGRTVTCRLTGSGDNPNETAEIVEIRVGLVAQGRDDQGRLTNYRPVLAGLKEGDRVVAPISRLLKTGQFATTRLLGAGGNIGADVPGLPYNKSSIALPAQSLSRQGTITL